MEVTQLGNAVDGGDAAELEPKQELGEPEETVSHEERQNSPEDQCAYTYHNNLLWAVGLLEWSNAMDFPANIFNSIPTPIFAQVLMGLGGSIAILWSIFPLIDMLRSVRNIKVLRQERRLLKAWLKQLADKENIEVRSLIQAVLDVNFRELGWECIDRVLMDVCAGISGILVGTGALMAIRGDIDPVFTASNLLSGYVGNSFLAPFALINAIWAAFMWKRANEQYSPLTEDDLEAQEVLRKRMASHARKHRLYAMLNGVTAVTGAVGSIVSSTLWYGYVVIAPCVFTLLFCNLFWRYRLGYTRSAVQSKDDLLDLELEHTLAAVMLVSRAAVSNAWQEDNEALGFLRDLRDTNVFFSRPRTPEPIKSKAVTNPTTAQDRRQGPCPLQLTKQQKKLLIYRERYLLELYGRYLRQIAVLDPKEGSCKQQA